VASGSRQLLSAGELLGAGGIAVTFFFGNFDGKLLARGAFRSLVKGRGAAWRPNSRRDKEFLPRR